MGGGAVNGVCCAIGVANAANGDAVDVDAADGDGADVDAADVGGGVATAADENDGNGCVPNGVDGANVACCAPNASACAGAGSASGFDATAFGSFFSPANFCEPNLTTPDLRELPTPAKVDFTGGFNTLISVLAVRFISVSPVKTKLELDSLVNAAGGAPSCAGAPNAPNADDPNASDAGCAVDPNAADAVGVANWDVCSCGGAAAITDPTGTIS